MTAVILDGKRSIASSMNDPNPRVILHVDMDAFYAAVEELDDPSLRDVPVIVGGLGPRGVVSTANYPARVFGVRSAMPMAKARQLCPQARYIRPRMARYREISGRVFEIFKSITPTVEGLSLDEAFLDVSGSSKMFGSGRDIAVRVKAGIFQDIGLTASVGIAHNKFLAKLASELQKPDGLVLVPPDRVHAFLDPMPVSRLWGIGARTLPKLKAAGILTFGQLRRADVSALRNILGNRALHFQALASGEDDREVVPDSPDKSISHEMTFDADLTDQRELLAELQRLTEAVAQRLRKRHLIAQTVVVKIRDSAFRTVTRSRTMRAGSSSTLTLYRMARALFETWRESNRNTPVRLLGMGATGLENRLGSAPLGNSSAGDQLDLRQHQQLDAVFDEINQRYGEAGIVHGLALRRRPEGGSGKS